MMEPVLAEIVSSVSGKHTLSKILDQLDQLRRSRRIDLDQFEQIYKRVINESRLDGDRWFEKYQVNQQLNFSFDLKKSSAKKNDENNPNTINKLLSDARSAQETCKPITSPTNFPSPPTYETRWSRLSDYQSDHQKEYSSQLNLRMTNKIMQQISERKRISVSEHNKSIQVSFTKHHLEGFEKLKNVVLRKVLQLYRYSFNKILYRANEPVKVSRFQARDEQELEKVLQRHFQGKELRTIFAYFDALKQVWLRKKRIKTAYVTTLANRKTKYIERAFFSLKAFAKRHRHKTNSLSQARYVYEKKILGAVFDFWNSYTRVKRQKKCSGKIASGYIKVNERILLKSCLAKLSKYAKGRRAKSQTQTFATVYYKRKLTETCLHQFQQNAVKQKEKRRISALLTGAAQYFMFKLLSKCFQNWRVFKAGIQTKQQKHYLAEQAARLKKKMLKDKCWKGWKLLWRESQGKKSKQILAFKHYFQKRMRGCLEVLKACIERRRKSNKMIREFKERQSKARLGRSFGKLKSYREIQREKQKYYKAVCSKHNKKVISDCFSYLKQYPKYNKEMKYKSFLAARHFAKSLQIKYFRILKDQPKFRVQKKYKMRLSKQYHEIILMKRVFRGFDAFLRREREKNKKLVLILAYSQCMAQHRVLQSWHQLCLSYPLQIKRQQQRRILQLWLSKCSSSNKIKKFCNKFEQMNLRIFFKHMKLIKSRDYQRKKIMAQSRLFYLQKAAFRALKQFREYKVEISLKQDQLRQMKTRMLMKQAYVKIRRAYLFEHNVAYLTAFSILTIKKRLLEKYFAGFKAILLNKKRPREYQIRLNKLRRCFAALLNHCTKHQAARKLVQELHSIKANYFNKLVRRLRQIQIESEYTKHYNRKLKFKVLSRWRRFNDMQQRMTVFLRVVQSFFDKSMTGAIKTIQAEIKANLLMQLKTKKLAKHSFHVWLKKSRTKLATKSIERAVSVLTIKRISKVFEKLIVRVKDSRLQEMLAGQLKKKVFLNWGNRCGKIKGCRLINEFLSRSVVSGKLSALRLLKLNVKYCKLKDQLARNVQLKYFLQWRKLRATQKGLCALAQVLEVSQAERLEYALGAIKLESKSSGLVTLRESRLLHRAMLAWHKRTTLKVKIDVFASKLQAVLDGHYYQLQCARQLFYQFRKDVLMKLQGQMMLKNLETMVLGRQYFVFQFLKQEQVYGDFLLRRQWVTQVRCFTEWSRWANKQIALKFIAKKLDFIYCRSMSNHMVQIQRWADKSYEYIVRIRQNKQRKVLRMWQTKSLRSQALNSVMKVATEYWESEAMKRFLKQAAVGKLRSASKLGERLQRLESLLDGHWLNAQKGVLHKIWRVSRDKKVEGHLRRLKKRQVVRKWFKASERLLEMQNRLRVALAIGLKANRRAYGMEIMQAMKLEKKLQLRQEQEDKASLKYAVFTSWRMQVGEKKMLKKYLSECSQQERRGTSTPKYMPY